MYRKLDGQKITITIQTDNDLDKFSTWLNDSKTTGKSIALEISGVMLKIENSHIKDGTVVINGVLFHEAEKEEDK